MDSSRRRALGLSAGSALALALPFPFAAARAASQPPKIALVMKSLANEFFLTMENGARAHQKAHASEYTLLANGIRDETDTSGQIRLIEQMIVTRVDALVLAPADSKALVPVVKKAVDAGILVVNIDNRLDPEALKDKGLKVPFVGPDNRKGARLVGDFVARSLKPGDAIGIIEGVPTTTNAQQRTAGFKDAAQAARLRIVSVQSGEWEIDKGNKVAAAMLRAQPDIKALLCGNDNMAIGAVSAVRAAGKTGRVLIGGYDDIAAIKAMLADGRVAATADQHADQQAVYGIQTALKALVAKTPQAQLGGVIETPVNLITRT
ncbi:MULTISPECIES: sugar ABC transporter substrate-binding protein [Ralstonia solanacearum species complex]|uniref:Substrate-binding domain-containing protein n=1 Tax=Ralstonia syzygii TaxID=28097 RepID=A0ABX7ZG82_9RALS|nr:MULTISPECIES: sugar ABC transporter substrate-binding protein [Ralstonia solanacearum species complex]BEU72702.1 sugar ABC transporter substrate-binding protein [Ralstonia pseudosolanacearum]AXV77542.1 LacI family transcriptional regulator [Ralstonia solanacearum]AXV91563.1 LacI family transcriptional regulator [Ralstonia solanacearum]AXW06465.1 LacI family transcriptional regulator [Ralstonia solanacearum]AXW19682.1 LacI family transcriptional regulator [Ralstonia solanacearum]